MDEKTKVITLSLSDKSQVKIEASLRGGAQVASVDFPIKGLTDAIEGISREIAATIERVKPKKATVKFGVEVSIESGQLTALIVKGGGKGNLEIALEWGG